MSGHAAGAACFYLVASFGAMTDRRCRCAGVKGFKMVADEVWLVLDRRGAAQEVVGAGVISTVGSEVFHG